MKIISYRKHSFESLVKQSRPGNRRPIQLLRPIPASKRSTCHVADVQYVSTEGINEPASKYLLNPRNTQQALHGPEADLHQSTLF